MMNYNSNSKTIDDNVDNQQRLMLGGSKGKLSCLMFLYDEFDESDDNEILYQTKATTTTTTITTSEMAS
jgi:hypothetical protein